MKADVADTLKKIKQLQRTAASIRTLSELSTQTSMYIPISPPRRHPSYMQPDRAIEWHSSALLSAGVETATLPSRLRPNNVRRGLLGDMAAALNMNGNQKLAELQYSVLDPGNLLETCSEHQARRDTRIRSNSYTTTMEPNAGPKLDLDMNLSGEDPSPSLRLRPPKTRVQVFGAAACLRTPRENHSTGDPRDEEIDAGFARKRARFAKEPVVERYALSSYVYKH